MQVVTVVVDVIAVVVGGAVTAATAPRLEYIYIHEPGQLTQLCVSTVYIHTYTYMCMYIYIHIHIHRVSVVDVRRRLGFEERSREKGQMRASPARTKCDKPKYNMYTL